MHIMSLTGRLFPIIGKRAVVTFGLVTFLVAALLATVNITSRYALKLYVEDQLQRIPWDIAVYQKGAANETGERLRHRLSEVRGVIRTENLVFLRARFPEGASVTSEVGGKPLTAPWTCLLSASDLSILPPVVGTAIERGQSPTTGDTANAVLALVGPERAMGKAFLSLQGAREFSFKVTVAQRSTTLFSTPIRGVVRLDRDDLNRWLMDQTGSVSYVPHVGVILLMPYDAQVVSRFDNAANGLVPMDLLEHEAQGGDMGHVQSAEYEPELVHLMRVDRARLISGWDIPGSLVRVQHLIDAVDQVGHKTFQRSTRRTGPDVEFATYVEPDAGHRTTASALRTTRISAPHDGVSAPHDSVSSPHDSISSPHDSVSSPHDTVSSPHDPRQLTARQSPGVLLVHDPGEGGPEEEIPNITGFVVDSTTLVLLQRMDRVARLIGVVTLLVALPLLWMGWVLAANLSGLLMLNERHVLGLLRLRGIAGRSIGRVLLLAILGGGLVGGVLGLVAGCIVPLMVYEGGRLPVAVLMERQQLTLLGAFLAVTLILAVLVSRRLVRYATTISPLEASRHVATSEIARASLRFGVLPALSMALGTYVLVFGWILDRSVSNGIRTDWAVWGDRLLDFLGLPLFLYGVTTLIATHRAWIQQLLAPLIRPIGGTLGRLAQTHVSVKPHRTVTFLLVVALMGSVSLYPTITSRSFSDKAARGARVQLGTDWQLLFNAPDLVDASRLKGGVHDQLSALAPEIERLVVATRRVAGVRDATWMVEALLPNFYLPGYGLRGVPLFIVGDPAAYRASVYSEPEVGLTAPFDAVLQPVSTGAVAMSPPVADFWDLKPGSPVLLGLDQERLAVKVPSSGVVAFLPGIPPRTISDRQSYVQARVDYLNHLFSSNAYVVASADNPKLAGMQVLISRVVVLAATSASADAAAVGLALERGLPYRPLEVHNLDQETAKVGSDMFISLALANMRIYLLGGFLLAAIAILAVAMTNYSEDRRTLGMLRIRGASPTQMWRFVVSLLLSPALLGILIGGLTAALAGYGLTNYVWRLREIRTVVQLLPTRLVASATTAYVLLLIVGLLVAVASGFSWWVFRRTAHQKLQGV